MDISKVSEKQFILRCPKEKRKKKKKNNNPGSKLGDNILQKVAWKLKWQTSIVSGGAGLFVVLQNTIKMYLLISPTEDVKKYANFY